MVNRNLLRQYDLSEDELQEELDATFSHESAEWLPMVTSGLRDWGFFWSGPAGPAFFPRSVPGAPGARGAG